jgi:hypothetical protein
MSEIDIVKELRFTIESYFADKNIKDIKVNRVSTIIYIYKTNPKNFCFITLAYAHPDIYTYYHYEHTDNSLHDGKVANLDTFDFNNTIEEYKMRLNDYRKTIINMYKVNAEYTEMLTTT